MISGQLEGRKLLGIPWKFSFRAWAIKHVVDSDHVAFISQCSLSNSFVGCSGWRRTFSSSTLMLTASIGVRLLY
jgi:hypothetical protein